MAGQCLRPELRHYGAAGDDLVGEQIAGADQHPDPHAALDQWRRHYADHRRRQPVMDAAGKQDVHRGGIVRRDLAEQQLDLALPQDQARQRADMAAAFPAFEDEAPRPLVDEQLEQFRRRRVDVSRDSLRFELRRLVGPPAGDQREGRLDLPDRADLRLADFTRRETQEADAPAAIAQQRRGFVQQPLGLFAGHQRQREERQSAAARNRVGERRRIRDPRHRTLDDWIAGTVRGGQGTIRPQRPQPTRGLDQLAAAPHHGLNQPAGGLEAIAIGGGKADALPDRPRVRFGLAPTDDRGRLRKPVGAAIVA